MRAVVVVESCFGNTSTVADAIVEGLRSAGVEVEAHSAESAPRRVRADLIFVGAPTHNLGLSTPTSRGQAADKGGNPAATGVREWVDAVEVLDGRTIAFSTKTKGMFAGSAGKAIVKALKRRNIRAERGDDFTVAGTTGPITAGELDRAREWGRTLADQDGHQSAKTTP